MDLATILLIGAVILFVLAAVLPQGWMLPIGLALFAGAFLVSGLGLNLAGR